MYVAGARTIRRPSRPASTTPAPDHFCALADVCAVAFEVCAAARHSFSAAARAAAGAGSLFAILLVSFAVAPMIGSRRRGS